MNKASREAVVRSFVLLLAGSVISSYCVMPVLAADLTSTAPSATSTNSSPVWSASEKFRNSRVLIVMALYGR